MVDWDTKLNAANAKDDENMEWHEVIYSAALNLPGSSYELGKNIISAIAHPVETGKAVGRIATGAAEKIPGVSHLTPGPTYDIEGKPSRGGEFDAMVDFFSGRYGSVEGFKKAVATDPAGVLADGATVLSGGGGLVRGAGKAASLVPKIASAANVVEKTGAAMQKAGSILEPTNVIKQATRIIPAERLYESAVKWNTASRKPGRTGQQVRQALTKTALDNKIEPTYKGLNKLRGMIDVLDDQISELVKTPTQAGVMIPAEELLSHFKDLEKQVWKTSGRGVKAINEVKRVKREFQVVHGVFEDANGNLSHPHMRAPGEMPPRNSELIGFESLTPDEIQKKKTTIYRDLESSYEKMTTAPAGVKAQKAIARGAKDALAELIPAIKKVNKNYGPLKELYKALDQKAGRISNYDLIPAAVTWKAGMGYAATGGATAGAAGGMALGLLDTPVVKAKIAILVKSLQKRGLKVNPESIALLGIFQTGRATEVIDDRLGR